MIDLLDRIEREHESPFHKELRTAKIAALKAGKIIMKGYGLTHETQTKADNSLASTVDIAAEASIRKKLADTFPNHAFWGEESGKSPLKSSDLWIVDGLDGSHNYLKGVPFFSVSIAYFKDGELMVGVINDPLHNELYWAEKDRGSFLNGRVLHVSTESELSHSTIGFTRGPAKEDKSLLGRIYNVTGQEVRNTRVLGSVALHFAYVASGRFDALINIGNHPWDFAAGILLINEAGGKVTDLEANDFNPTTNRIIASNGVCSIHDPIINIARTQAFMKF